MDAEERRKRILDVLRESKKPVSGSNLGELLCVSRQVVVQDIALLRAKGVEILATPQGYVLTSRLWGRPQRVFAVQHSPENIELELETMVKQGGKILDVIVEHPLYGELRGLLMISSMADLKEYLEKYKEYKAEPLSALTGGVHLHTVEAENESRLTMISEALRKRGFLLEEV